MNANVNTLSAALKKANAPLVYGLGGISMEEQRLAVNLAQKLRAAVAAERMLLPTLTTASFKGCSLLLTAGGEPPFPVSGDIRVLRDDRLLDTAAWRALSSLFRGNRLPGAEAYLSLYEEVKEAKKAAVLLVTGSLDEALRRAVTRFIEEAHWMELLHISPVENALGAYEVLLEEAGGESAWFGGGQCRPGVGYDGLACGGYDLLLRVGEGRDLTSCGLPCYAIAPNGRDGECLIEADSAGGMALRYDGVGVEMAAKADGANSIHAILTELLEEVDA